MQYRYQYNQSDTSFNSAYPSDGKDQDLQQLRYRLYTAKNKLTSQLHRTPTGDELWLEIGNMRYTDFMEFMQAEIKFIISECHREGEVLTTRAILKICDDWGADAISRGNILEWADAFYAGKMKEEPPYSLLTDVKQFLDEKKHIPVFKEYAYDSQGRLLSVFNDDSFRKVKAVLNSISASQETITPKTFHDVLVSCAVPISYVDALADYAVKLNLSILARENPQLYKKPEPVAEPVPSRPIRTDDAESFYDFHQRMTIQPDTPAAERETVLSLNPSAVPDHSEPVVPFDPAALFSDLDHDDTPDYVFHSQYEESEKEDADFHPPSGKDRTDNSAQSAEELLKAACRQLSSILYENCSQTKLFCNTPIVFLRSAESKVISVFSAIEAMPKMSFEYGDSIRVMSRTYDRRILNLSVSPNREGVTILRLESENNSILKIIFFVF